MAFHLYVSSDLEVLAKIFREEVYEKVSSGDPLEPVTVTVQTQGMSVWLRQYLAGNSKIAMNLDMPFLRGAIERELTRIYPEAEKDFFYQHQEQSVWQIFSWISEEEHLRTVPELQEYLQNDPDLRKRYQISREIARLYEQYRIYRPEMIVSWREGTNPAPEWQERIYRELFREERTLDVYLHRFAQESAGVSCRENGKRFSVFGVSSMAPCFLEFFLNLSKYQEIYFFYLSPSEEYWADAVTRQQAKRQGLPDSVKQELEENNNPLLTAFGGQGRAFFRNLLQSDLWDIAEEHPQESYREDFLLGALQSDIRHNRNGLAGRTLAPDGSILIENCHTPLREIQVLHDRILKEVENGRLPGEILVTAPDIEEYVSSIETVFGTGPLSGCYTIADRSLHRAGMIFPALLKLIEVSRSDYSSSVVFSPLENDLILQNFGLTRQELDRIRDWCIKSGIRWGVDEQTRKEECGIGFDLFSWYYGIRRMLLGYAVREDMLHQDGMPVIPFDFAEGNEAAPLGKFLDYLEELIRLRDLFADSRTMRPEEWFCFLKELPDRFFDPEGEPAAIQERAALIRKLSELEYSSRFCNTEVPFAVMDEILKSLDTSSGNTGGYLRGKITFCSMVPMRTIPMPVVAVLGMEEGRFPRRDTVPGFNLISQFPKDTDRSGSQEDRYLLLETILSAREKLYIFYEGQSSRDNSEKYPSPPLAELIRYLEQISGSADLSQTLFLKHKLLPYDPFYFTGKQTHFYTYSDSARIASESAGKKKECQENDLPAELFTGNTFGEIALPESVTLEELEKFFSNPASYYLLQKKGITIPRRRSQIPDDREVFHLNHLQVYQLKSQILEAARCSVDLETFRIQLQKCGSLPIGFIGEECYRKLLEEIKPLLASVFMDRMIGMQNVTLKRKIPYQLNGTTGFVEFSGTLPLTEDQTRHIDFELAKRSPEKYYKYWLRHIFLSAMLENYDQTVCVFQDKSLFLKKTDPGFAAEKLLLFAAMREAGAEKLFPYSRETSCKQSSYSDHFRTNLISKLSRDSAAALIYRKKDFDDPEFCQKFIDSAQLFYAGFKEERKGVL